MLRFEASSYAIAGVIVSAIPILIHLLYRRTFKTVHWAATEFLKQALDKERKRLRIRDVLLLICRILAILSIGFAFSKPSFRLGLDGTNFWMWVIGLCGLIAVIAAVGWATSSKERGKVFAATFFISLIVPAIHLFDLIGSPASPGEGGARTPIHVVLVVDNSRSLAVETTTGTLLDRAKTKAVEFIDRLPPESRITVVCLAGSEEITTLDAFRNKDDAREAVNRIAIVDARANCLSGFHQAEAACRQTLEPSIKRIVLITDLQANSWTATETGDAANAFPLGKFPAIELWGLQVVSVAQEAASNIWVTGFHLEDELVSNDAPCRFLAKIHSSMPGRQIGPSADQESFLVQVHLSIDGSVIASQTIELTPGQEREIEFIHQFDLRIDPLKPGSVLAAIEVQSELPAMDQLTRDNRQQSVVPVASSVPVVFIDQYGDQENVDQNRIGETYALRHLMAPRSNGNDSRQRLVNEHHLRPEELTRTDLESARLVVVAGIEKPEASFVSLLRQYVIQGGSLVILAGAEFNPAAWTENAWLDGQGILPVPLDAKPIGNLPDESADRIVPFVALFASMQSDYFLVEGEDPEMLASLFESTPFFKAVQAKVDKTFLAEQLIRDTKQFEHEKPFRDDYEHRQAIRSGELNGDQVSDNDDARYRQLAPTWWNWRMTQSRSDQPFDARMIASMSQPKVLARFAGNGHPWVVERRTGAGEVVLFTSGVTSNWNLLRSSPAMYLFHRTFCQLIERTFPQRTFTAGETFTLPVERRSGRRSLLKRPTGPDETIESESIGVDQLRSISRRALVAGGYRLVTQPSDAQPGNADERLIDEIRLAVNGEESESDLRSISSAQLQTRLGALNVAVLDWDEPIRLEGGSRSSLWKFVAWCALVCLFVEKLILSWPLIRNRLLASRRVIAS